MAEWIFGREQGGCAWLGPRPWQAQRTPLPPKSHLSQCDALLLEGRKARLTDSIRILPGRRALRCFQNELHHFIILNLKWYNKP